MAPVPCSFPCGRGAEIKWPRLDSAGEPHLPGCYIARGLQLSPSQLQPQPKLASLVVYTVQPQSGVCGFDSERNFRTSHYEAESRFNEDFNIDSRVRIKRKG